MDPFDEVSGVRDQGGKQGVFRVKRARCKLTVEHAEQAGERFSILKITGPQKDGLARPMTSRMAGGRSAKRDPSPFRYRKNPYVPKPSSKTLVGRGC